MGGGGGNPNRPDHDRLDDQARQLIEAASTYVFFDDLAISND